MERQSECEAVCRFLFDGSASHDLVWPESIVALPKRTNYHEARAIVRIVVAMLRQGLRSAVSTTSLRTFTVIDCNRGLKDFHRCHLHDPEFAESGRDRSALDCRFGACVLSKESEVPLASSNLFPLRYMIHSLRSYSGPFLKPPRSRTYCNPIPP